MVYTNSRRLKCRKKKIKYYKKKKYYRKKKYRRKNNFKMYDGIPSYDIPINKLHLKKEMINTLNDMKEAKNNNKLDKYRTLNTWYDTLELVQDSGCITDQGVTYIYQDELCQDFILAMQEKLKLNDQWINFLNKLKYRKRRRAAISTQTRYVIGGGRNPNDIISKYTK